MFKLAVYIRGCVCAYVCTPDNVYFSRRTVGRFCAVFRENSSHHHAILARINRASRDKCDHMERKSCTSQIDNERSFFSFIQNEKKRRTNGVGTVQKAKYEKKTDLIGSQIK